MIVHKCDRCGEECNDMLDGMYEFKLRKNLIKEGFYIGDYGVTLCPSCSESLERWFKNEKPNSRKSLDSVKLFKKKRYNRGWANFRKSVLGIVSPSEMFKERFKDDNTFNRISKE